MKQNGELTPAGFREVEHTADWQLEVWAPDMISLFEQAAYGMYKLTGAQFNPNSAIQKRSISIEGEEKEILLVKFLSELLYYNEVENLGFNRFELQSPENRLTGEMYGSEIISLEKVIKAITYHKLEIRKTARGLEVSIVFDV